MIVVAGIAAYYGYRYMNSGVPAPVTRTNGGGGSSSELLVVLGSLRGLKFDTSFFDDRIYKSLQDVTPDISVPEVRGKANPFVVPLTGLE